MRAARMVCASGRCTTTNLLTSLHSPSPSSSPPTSQKLTVMSQTPAPVPAPVPAKASNQVQEQPKEQGAQQYVQIPGYPRVIIFCAGSRPSRHNAGRELSDTAQQLTSRTLLVPALRRRALLLLLQNRVRVRIRPVRSCTPRRTYGHYHRCDNHRRSVTAPKTKTNASTSTSTSVPCPFSLPASANVTAHSRNTAHRSLHTAKHSVSQAYQ